ncbi:hypothetical protein FA15DRAFT_667499 [Coprinopsis marcescibilis]|uniref:DNA-directed DNA polymerase n=1 Tax=Coprinopsis marcescibilis TaxID=230819 RepID=A0A5C3L167_COPMA|nr:hypothetical protein FA15DRAFT_667499 [Coprinopsis marcescibilis]
MSEAQTSSSSPLVRPATTTLARTKSTPSFITTNKSYRHQYSNIYFMRLKLLRLAVEERALQRWGKLDDRPELVPRVLEVTKGQLCYIIGTVYMEMPLKANVMEDITRDRSIQAPPPKAKFYSPEDSVMLEDESGRIHLVGACLKDARLVTGVIIGALGMETPNGDFEVIDVCLAGLPPQLSALNEEEDMYVDESSSDPWIAVASGLDVGSDNSSDARIQLLVEYLTGECEVADDQVLPSQIARLILAGDSLSSASITARADAVAAAEDKKQKKIIQDRALLSPHPIHTLASHLLDIGRSLPIHILPGELDPSGTIMPQQPLPRVMFSAVSKLPTFSCESNPTYIRVVPGEVEEPKEGEEVGTNVLSKLRTLLVNSGQPLNDMFKYLPNRNHSRLSILESTLKWRHMAPTAPDTLWCHPFIEEDPFILYETPDIYIVGGQKRFGTKLVEGERAGKGRKPRCRLVMVPHFGRTGVLVLINLRTLAVKCMNFSIEGMTGGGDTDAVLEGM